MLPIQGIRPLQNSKKTTKNCTKTFSPGNCYSTQLAHIDLTGWRSAIRKDLVSLPCELKLSNSFPSTHTGNREVHLSDLIRAHVGNGDFHPEDPSKIHWAKFNMMGKFVHLVKQYQLRCRNAEDDYSFEERPELRGVLNVAIMDSEVSLCVSNVQDDNPCPRRCNYRESHPLQKAMKTMIGGTSRVPCLVISRTDRTETLLSAS
jgi:hypothetical protein